MPRRRRLATSPDGKWNAFGQVANGQHNMDIRDIWDVLYLHRRRAIPAVVAVVLAAVTFVAFINLAPGSEPVEAPSAPPVVAETPPPGPEPEPPAAPVEVELAEAASVWPTLLVSKQAIEAGDVLGTEHVEWREWRDPIDLGAAILQAPEAANLVLGSTARAPFPAGVPIPPSGISIRSNPTFISGMLEPAMRAVTVEADGATTRAGLIEPGDRVDVILVSTGAETLAQTIARDVRVLAVGAALASGAPLGLPTSLGGLADALGIEMSNTLDAVSPARQRGDTFTLEVSPTDAERVALAVSLGRITLAMRAAAAIDATSTPTQAVRLADVLVVPENVALAPVRIIRGVGPATPSPSPVPAALLGS